MNNKTPTPRTDAEIDDARNIALEFLDRTTIHCVEDYANVISADFARQLERELNSSKDWNTAAFAATSIASATIARLERERDQLKNVADELALAIHTGNEHGYGLRIGDRAIELYNSLPHVIAKGKTK